MTDSSDRYFRRRACGSKLEWLLIHEQQTGLRDFDKLPMTYLLDVNALVALGFVNHEFHNRVASWLRAQEFPPLATCSITELGFLRVLAQAPDYGLTVAQARTLLLRLKQAEAPGFTFIRDDHDISHLPGWVKTPRQTTDGHLVKLASANRAVLATLDGKIPGAYLIQDV